MGVRISDPHGRERRGRRSESMDSELPMKRRIRSSWAHRGSPFADWAVPRLTPFVRPILEALHIPSQAFFDLTTTSCRRFNEETPNAAGVRYFSVAGRLQLGRQH